MKLFSRKNVTVGCANTKMSTPAQHVFYRELWVLGIVISKYPIF